MRKPTLQLAALAAASFIIYALAFVWHYSLFEWWSIPQETIAKISRHDPLAAAAYVIAVAALFLLYALACRLARGEHRAAAWRVVIVGALAFNAMLLLLYPVDAADIFDNIVHGRMTALYGGNPFYQSAVDLPQDKFFGYAAWDYYPSAYGPGWELLAAGAAKVAGDNVSANVLTFKLVSVLAFVGAAALIALTLRKHAPERALYGTVLFAWNPLALYITAGNGHNDAVMVLFIAVAFYLLVSKRFTSASIALTIGATIKFIPALLLPIVLIAGFKSARGWRARSFFLFVTLAACAVIVIGLYAPFWHGGDILGVERRSDLLTTSLPTLIDITLEPGLGKSISGFVTIRIAAVLLMTWTIRELRKLWRRDISLDALAYAGTSILLCYLLVACLWFQPWYAIWPIALAALLPDDALARGALLLSFAVTWKMPLFEFVLVPGPTLPPRDWREWRITLGTLGAVWAFCVYQLPKNWKKKRYGSRITRDRETPGAGTNQNAADSALVG